MFLKHTDALQLPSISSFVHGWWLCSAGLGSRPIAVRIIYPFRLKRVKTGDTGRRDGYTHDHLSFFAPPLLHPIALNHGADQMEINFLIITSNN